MTDAVGSDDLAGLLGSRLCHDLISPIGAVGNGLELLNMTGSAKSPEMALISESLANAQARIRFYRIAFGACRAGQAVGAPELVDILAGVFGAGRLKVDWQVQGGVGRDAAKLAFLLVLCLESSLSHGGQIAVARDGRHWKVTGAGRRYRDLEAFWPILEGKTSPEPLTPGRVHFPLARDWASAIGLALSQARDDTGIRIIATPA